MKLDACHNTKYFFSFAASVVKTQNTIPLFKKKSCSISCAGFVWWQERQYKQIPTVDQLAVHFALDGNMLHKDSDEARRQRQKMGMGDGEYTADWHTNVEYKLDKG
jgi:hypothetical protein